MNYHCVYCRKIGHVKAFCPVLKEKIEQKKSLRTKKQQEKKFSNIVKKFGTSEERMNDLYREILEMIRAFEFGSKRRQLGLVQSSTGFVWASFNGRRI